MINGGKTLLLKEPLSYRHLGVTEAIHSRSLHLRAEVGVLNQNVVVRGSVNHLWPDEITRCHKGYDSGEANFQSHLYKNKITQTVLLTS